MKAKKLPERVKEVADTTYYYQMKAPKNIPATEFITNLQNLLEANQEFDDAILNSYNYKSVNMLSSIEVKNGNLIVGLKTEILKK
jgi:hypothetical protein